jgi:hypothetical protein
MQNMPALVELVLSPPRSNGSVDYSEGLLVGSLLRRCGRLEGQKQVWNESTNDSNIKSRKYSKQFLL